MRVLPCAILLRYSYQNQAVCHAEQKSNEAECCFGSLLAVLIYIFL